MKKIPTLFVRAEDRKSLTRWVNPDCEWVMDGEGVATEKIDGTSCMVREGKLYRRYDAKQGRTPPVDFEPAQDEPDPITGHWPGWVPVGDGPEDRYHREAWESDRNPPLSARNPQQIEGTWELIGPKVQGNPYDLSSHMLIRHGSFCSHIDISLAPRDFSGLLVWLSANRVEGIVWHHPDGRMAKIKRRDFGLQWPIK